MLRVIAFGIAAGFGVQALRAWPAGGPVTQNGVAVIGALAVLLAYLAGRWRGRGNVRATATAVASARAASLASSSVNIAFVSPGGGARPVGVSVPSEAEGVEWFGAPRNLPSLDELDGMELGELVEDEADSQGVAR